MFSWITETVLNGTLSLAEALADCTENEVDDNIVKALQLIADGEISQATVNLLRYLSDQTENEIDDNLVDQIENILIDKGALNA